MLIMIIYEFGDIVLVPFPFTDQTSTKKRPAVIISSNAYNRDRPDLIIMAITSQLYRADKETNRLVKNWQGAGLIKPSVFKPILATIKTDMVLKRLGSLQNDDRETLKQILRDILG
jgi:mRNA interferase MazF